MSGHSSKDLAGYYQAYTFDQTLSVDRPLFQA